MLTFDPLLEASERGRRRRAEADAEALVPRPTTRLTLAEVLRKVADRLDPVVTVREPRLR